MNNDSVAESLKLALNEFYESHLVPTVDQSIQVFRSFTYGEMVISFILLCILFVLSFKWLWEVVR